MSLHSLQWNCIYRWKSMRLINHFVVVVVAVLSTISLNAAMLSLCFFFVSLVIFATMQMYYGYSLGSILVYRRTLFLINFMPDSYKIRSYKIYQNVHASLWVRVCVCLYVFVTLKRVIMVWWGTYIFHVLQQSNNRWRVEHKSNMMMTSANDKKKRSAEQPIYQNVYINFSTIIGKNSEQQQKNRVATATATTSKSTQKNEKTNQFAHIDRMLDSVAVSNWHHDINIYKIDEFISVENVWMRMRMWMEVINWNV